MGTPTRKCPDCGKMFYAAKAEFCMQCSSKRSKARERGLCKTVFFRHARTEKRKVEFDEKTQTSGELRWFLRGYMDVGQSDPGRSLTGDEFNRVAQEYIRREAAR